MMGIKSIADIADILGIANLFLNTKQVKQQKLLRLILANQLQMMDKLKDMEKPNEKN